MGATAKNAIPYPELDDPADVPADMKEMADKLDTFGFVPPGAMFMWPGVAAPAGFLLCQGQTDVPVAGNPTLAALFGATGGFVKMPDLRDAFVRGASAGRVPLSTGGEEYHKSTAEESGMPGHGHGNSLGVNAAAAQAGAYPWFPVGDGTFQRVSVDLGAAHGTVFNLVQSANLVSYANGTHGHTLSGSVSNAAKADASIAHNNVPPYMALNYIVRAG